MDIPRFPPVKQFTAIDNVAMALELSGESSKDAEQRAAAALERVGLGDRMHHIPTSYLVDSNNVLPLLGQLLAIVHYYLQTSQLEIWI